MMVMGTNGWDTAEGDRWMRGTKRSKFRPQLSVPSTKIFDRVSLVNGIGMRRVLRHTGVRETKGGGMIGKVGLAATSRGVGGRGRLIGR